MGAQWFHSDGQTDRRNVRQTDMTKPIVTLRNFVNVFKNHVQQSLLPAEGTADTEVQQLNLHRISFFLQHATALFCNNSP
jgi:hypothetical protein